jgi:hypothetical protein
MGEDHVMDDADDERSELHRSASMGAQGDTVPTNHVEAVVPEPPTIRQVCPSNFPASWTGCGGP